MSNKPSVTTPDPEGLGETLIAVAVAGALLTAGAFIGFGARLGFSSLVGAALAVSNLYVLGRMVHALMPRSKDDGGRKPAKAAAWGMIAFAKIMLLFGGIWFLMTHGIVDPIGLVVGYAALPVGIGIQTVRANLH